MALGTGRADVWQREAQVDRVDGLRDQGKGVMREWNGAPRLTGNLARKHWRLPRE